MSWIDKSLMTEPRLLAMLGQGERLLATASVGAALSGVERIIEPPEPPPPPRQSMTRGGRVIAAAAVVGAAALGPTGWSGGDLPLRLLGGTRVLGTSGSAGVCLHRLLTDARDPTTLVITDRRVLVVAMGKTSWLEDPARPGKRTAVHAYRQLAAIPREIVVAARRRGRLGARGRVELYFGDGSMAAVMMGIVLTGPARRILRTLALPATPAA